MKRILILMPLLTMVISSGAQNDPAAIRILDRFSENALAAPSVSMKFNAVTVDQLEGYTDTVPGTIILSRDKYRLELTDNIICSMERHSGITCLLKRRLQYRNLRVTMILS